jgi:hypothetical protein
VGDDDGGDRAAERGMSDNVWRHHTGAFLRSIEMLGNIGRLKPL